MTDRDRLIELLENSPQLDAMYGEYDVAADWLLANGVTLREWISVKDRLPNIGCYVLFVRGNKIYGVGAYSDTYRDFFSGQFPVKGVTHWMPLPKPPKEVRS